MGKGKIPLKSKIGGTITFIRSNKGGSGVPEKSWDKGGGGIRGKEERGLQGFRK